MGKKEDELLDKLKVASKPDRKFILKLELDGEQVVESVSFPAENYTRKTIEAPKLYYMLVDFSRDLQEELKKQDLENRRKGFK